jgi:uncharacterized OB-fold protein
MSEIYQRTLPVIDDENRAFWQGGADGRLHLMRCQDCGYWLHPPGPVCPECLSDCVAVETVSGDATVETLTVNYKVWGAGMQVPYVIAIVELAEQKGLRLTTNIVGIDPEAVTIGMPVRVVFEQDEDVWLPLFEPRPA